MTCELRPKSNPRTNRTRSGSVEAPFSFPQPGSTASTYAVTTRCSTAARPKSIPRSTLPSRNPAKRSNIWVKHKLPHLTRHGLLSLRRQGLLPVDLATRQHRRHEVLHQQLHRVLQLHHLLVATGAAFLFHHPKPKQCPAPPLVGFCAAGVGVFWAAAVPTRAGTGMARNGR